MEENKPNYQSLLCQAMQVITDAAIGKLQYDKTIPAQIIAYINPENEQPTSQYTGYYRVQYQDAVFNCYSIDGSIKHDIQDWVWILIPSGDLSNTGKIILYGVNSNKVPTVQSDGAISIETIDEILGF